MPKTITISDETYKKIKKQIEEDKAGIIIRHRYTNEVIFESKAETYQDANLRGADLRGTNLQSANLRGADLRGTNLRDTDLRYADLRSADLRDANLRGAKTEYCKISFSSEEYEQAKQFIEGLNNK